ncbi:DUF3320 domain-containing protein [Aureibacillus halotolerans]|uniref:AAA domain-containing protein n=1 Tax=Aureibacillus halotolerans TaxID=1508390 RepID=A0A4R6TZB1_9BACI|nr:DUF3320 domain-containing protein [Aureibacillus halotolerans]TDQ37683.1 AAA domain-containing protein [Aureibacillus halotolerans]
MNAVDLTLDYSGVANYALQQNRVPLITELSLKNEGNEPLKNVRIDIMTNPSITRFQPVHFDIVPSEEAIVFTPELSYDTAELRRFEEAVQGTIDIRITSNDQLVLQTSRALEILAYNQWPGAAASPEIIASFITPNRPYIDQLLKDSIQRLKTKKPSSSMDGYQSADPAHTVDQVSAIYSSIQGKGIDYANPPASFEHHGQKVRFPDQVSETGMGTCLDLTVLFASCVEAAGLHPMLIFCRGHVFLGVWLTNEWMPEMVSYDKTYLTKRMADGINDLIVVETTHLTNSEVPFAEAIQTAKKAFDKPDYINYAVDIQRCRHGGIKALSLLAENHVVQSAPSVVPQTQNDYQAYAISRHSSDIDGSAASQQDKIGLWKSKLLDLGMRNLLLNYNYKRKGIPLISSDLGQIEDALHRGEKMKIEPAPSEFKGALNRSFSEVADEGLIQNELSQNRLRAYLDNEDLFKRATKIYRDAKEKLEENGANALFLALGFLQWIDPKSKKTRFAPILLMPVEMIRHSQQSGFSIKARTDDIQINISLVEYLRQAFSINASELYTLPEDEYGADVKRVMSDVRRLIMHMDGWDVLEFSSIGTFSFAKFVMWNDLRSNEAMLSRNPVVKSLIEGRKSFTQSYNFSEALTPEKEISTPSLVPLSADGSQMEALHAASSGESFVLHGPPGSGKSQTITNIITNTLGEGKTVLFVAEKMAALEVVYQKLKGIGLEPFLLSVYSNKAQKNQVLEQFDKSFKVERTASVNWEEYNTDIAQLKKSLFDISKELHEETTFGKSTYDMLQSFASLERPDVVASLDSQHVKNLTDRVLESHIELMKKTTRLGETCVPLKDHPWDGIGAIQYSLAKKDDITRYLQEVIRIGEPLRKSLREYLEGVSVRFTGESKTSLKGFLQKLEKIEQLDTMHLLAFLDEGQGIEMTRTVLVKNHELTVAQEQLSTTFDDRMSQVSEVTWLERLSEARTPGLFAFFKRRKAVNSLKPFLREATAQPSVELLQQYCDTTRRMGELEKELEPHVTWMDKAFGSSWRTKQQKDVIENDLTALAALEQLCNEPQSVGAIKSFLIHHDVDQRNLRGHAVARQALQKEVHSFESMLDVLKDTLEINDYISKASDWVYSVVEKAKSQLEHLDRLYDMVQYVHAKREAEKVGIEPMLVDFETGDRSGEEVVHTYRYSVLRQRIDKEVNLREHLRTFSEAEVELLLEKFKRMDEQLMKASQLEVAERLAKKNIQLENISEIEGTEVNKLHRAIRSRGRGLAMRQLFSSIPNTLSKLKPCVLMSPIAVSQYLSSDHPAFDLVIFDEASQMPTSEAVGAMARGRQVIVVGDPKQLPPTNFFNATINDEDDDVEMVDMESVLEDCLALPLPEKYLKWHYRSEHESLIAFSNRRYYDGQLVTFPSTDFSKDKVTFTNVKGTYERGGANVNKTEAEAIVTDVFRRLEDPILRKSSIGIVTFNSHQQELIADMIEEELSKKPELEEIVLNGEEPLFVKNLENVQGDERDTIYFSLCFGPDEEGKMTMNFGPLNREGGWRRLNVAITRAKQEMKVFASMEPEALQRAKAKGVQDLQAFMLFAKRASHSGGLSATREEEQHEAILLSIERKLAEKGYETERGVGMSAFKIELAVKHPDAPERYMAAILTDGHTAAAEKTIRDREKLKVDVLNRFGWTVLKVWTMSWWRNPDKQADALCEQLESIRAAAPIKEPTLQQQDETLSEVMTEPIAAVETVPLKKDVYEAHVLPEVVVDKNDFYTISSKEMIFTQMRQLVEHEAPISEQMLVKRISDAWGFKRAGSRIAQHVAECLGQTNYFVEEESDDRRFIWSTSESVSDFSLFREGDKDRRDSDDISFREYRNGIKHLSDAGIKLPIDEVVKRLNNLLGFQRLNQGVDERVRQTIDKMVTDGELTMDERMIQHKS